MRDGAIHYKIYLFKLTMAVDNVVLRIIKGVHINLLCMCFCTIPSNGQTSLSTGLVSLLLVERVVGSNLWIVSVEQFCIAYSWLTPMGYRAKHLNV